MNKNYLFPHRFRAIGWVLVIAAVAAFVAEHLWFPNFQFKMPALYYDGAYEFMDDDPAPHGFFVMATTTILSLVFPLLTIGLVLIGFSKEKIEDEFVTKVREQSLVWSTYITAILFILATLLIYGMPFMIVPYLVFFVFLILFIVKFKFELHRFNKGGSQ